MNIIHHFRHTWHNYLLGALTGAAAAALVVTAPEPGPAALQLAAGAAAVLLVVAVTRAATARIPRPAAAVQLRAAQPGGQPPAATEIAAQIVEDGQVEIQIGGTYTVLTGDEADELVAQIVAARTDQERAAFGRGRHTACPLCACLVTDGGHDQHDRWHLYIEKLRGQA